MIQQNQQKRMTQNQHQKKEICHETLLMKIFKSQYLTLMKRQHPYCQSEFHPLVTVLSFPVQSVTRVWNGGSSGAGFLTLHCQCCYRKPPEKQMITKQSTCGSVLLIPTTPSFLCVQKVFTIAQSFHQGQLMREVTFWNP